MDLKVIHPISFYGDTVFQSEDIGTIDLLPIVNEINTKSANIEDTLKDFLMNNITNLSNTFMIRILESNISKDEIAYIVDFLDGFNIRSYLNDSLDKLTLKNYDSENLCNIILSNIIFILNQFIQFYTIYKLVYSKEGVDLYKFLYKATYGSNPLEKEEPLQNKYVFCTSILSNMLEQEMKNISDCCIKLKDLIDNIRALNNI
jgi:hypothetical protein